MAMRAPTTHMMSAMPTLPDECRITLGVAKILYLFQAAAKHAESMSSAPRSNYAVKDKECRAGDAWQYCETDFFSLEKSTHQVAAGLAERYQTPPRSLLAWPSQLAHCCRDEVRRSVTHYFPDCGRPQRPREEKPARSRVATGPPAKDRFPTWSLEEEGVSLPIIRHRARDGVRRAGRLYGVVWAIRIKPTCRILT